MEDRVEKAIVELLNAAEEQVKHDCTELHNAVVLADDTAQQFGFAVETGLDMDAGEAILDVLKAAYKESSYFVGVEFLRIIMLLIGMDKSADSIERIAMGNECTAHCFLRRFIYFAEKEITYEVI